MGSVLHVYASERNDIMKNHEYADPIGQLATVH
jgi:hypothetical protein